MQGDGQRTTADMSPEARERLAELRYSEAEMSSLLSDVSGEVEEPGLAARVRNGATRHGRHADDLRHLLTAAGKMTHAPLVHGVRRAVEAMSDRVHHAKGQSQAIRALAQAEAEQTARYDDALTCAMPEDARMLLESQLAEDYALRSLFSAKAGGELQPRRTRRLRVLSRR